MITITQLRHEVEEMNALLRKADILCKLAVDKRKGFYNLAITHGYAGSKDVTQDTLWGGTARETIEYGWKFVYYTAYMDTLSSLREAKSTIEELRTKEALLEEKNKELQSGIEDCLLFWRDVHDV